MDKTTYPGVYNWATILDPETALQAMMLARSPVTFKHVALMPDAHVGKGATVGSVIATKSAVIPAAVGVDIGCGVIGYKTNLTKEDLPSELWPLHRRIAEVVPSGVGKNHTNYLDKALNWMRNNPIPHVFETNKTRVEQTVKASKQLGTLGSGNHFLEISLDDEDSVWVVIHSGSRGIGNWLATQHINIAKNLMQEFNISLENKDLAYLEEGMDEFDAYIDDVLWCQNYAMFNRVLMMENTLDVLFETKPFEVVEEINCHHNFTLQEEHFGETVWITRKGAISAHTGQYGIIPGSMATATYIVRGLGNPDSYCSSAHGAGRKLSRGKAKRELSKESLVEYMEGKTWNDRDIVSLLDEHPDAYKDIEQIMRDMQDLVEPVACLRQILNYKGV